MAISSRFQKRINDLVGDCEVSRSELPKVLQVNNVTLTHALAYGIVPRVKTLIRLADYFNVSIPYLLGETDENDFIKSENPSTFQARFGALCEENEVTHYKVSRKCYFDKSNISRWMTKGYFPTIEILTLLCGFFGVSMDYLLGRTDYRK